MSALLLLMFLWVLVCVCVFSEFSSLACCEMCVLSDGATRECGSLLFRSDCANTF